jgi:hypothetical protein
VRLDLDWDVPLEHRKGAEERLCGIDVFHEFGWLDVFPDERTQFKNGKALAKFVKNKCPPGKTPALLLTLREDVKQGFEQTENFAVFVVNIGEYRTSEGDAALSYLANHLDVDITDIERLHEITASADPELVRAFIESSLDIGLIADWALHDEERLTQLREVVEGASPLTTLPELLSALGSVDRLSIDDLRTVAEFLGSSADREYRLELARAVTADPTGRYVTGEVLAERTSERVADARRAIDAYETLLANAGTTETDMQTFIERHLWLLGLDYAALRPRRAGPSGTMDFMLERFDGFHDLLELKSPQDEIIRAPEVADGVPPSPHEYRLSATLAQALAQAVVYRDRLTRYAEVADELYGLPHARDPRLMIVLGKADSLPEHRRRILLELNKSLHRIEVVPYDVLAKRANAVLGNIERQLTAATEPTGG